MPEILSTATVLAENSDTNNAIQLKNDSSRSWEFMVSKDDTFVSEQEERIRDVYQSQWKNSVFSDEDFEKKACTQSGAILSSVIYNELVTHVYCQDEHTKPKLAFELPREQKLRVRARLTRLSTFYMIYKSFPSKEHYELFFEGVPEESDFPTAAAIVDWMSRRWDACWAEQGIKPPGRMKQRLAYKRKNRQAKMKETITPLSTNISKWLSHDSYPSRASFPPKANADFYYYYPSSESKEATPLINFLRSEDDLNELLSKAGYGVKEWEISKPVRDEENNIGILHYTFQLDRMAVEKESFAVHIRYQKSQNENHAKEYRSNRELIQSAIDSLIEAKEQNEAVSHATIWRIGMAAGMDREQILHLFQSNQMVPFSFTDYMNWLLMDIPVPQSENSFDFYQEKMDAWAALCWGRRFSHCLRNEKDTYCLLVDYNSAHRCWICTPELERGEPLYLPSENLPPNIIDCLDKKLSYKLYPEGKELKYVQDNVGLPVRVTNLLSYHWRKNEKGERIILRLFIK